MKGFDVVRDQIFCPATDGAVRVFAQKLITDLAPRRRARSKANNRPKPIPYFKKKGIHAHYYTELASFSVYISNMQTPCVRKCKLEKGICVGCKRTLDEIRDWTRLTDRKRERIVAELPSRKSPVQ